MYELGRDLPVFEGEDGAGAGLTAPVLSEASPAQATEQSPVAGSGEEAGTTLDPAGAGTPAPVGQPSGSPQVNWDSPDNPFRVQAQRATQILASIQMNQREQDLVRQGYPPEAIKAVLQAEAKNAAQEQMLMSLAQSPEVMEIAARRIVAPYAQYGIKPEDILSCPVKTPEALQAAAWALAQSRAKHTQTQRQATGQDSFEGSASSAGKVIDAKKMSSKDLWENAFTSTGKAK